MDGHQKITLGLSPCLPMCLRQGFVIFFHCVHQDSRPVSFQEFRFHLPLGVLVQKMLTLCLQLFHEFWDLVSGPHTCVASTLIH